MSAQPSPAELRRRIGHPIVDADGHVLEMLPAVFPFLRESLGSRLFEDYLKQGPPVRRRVGARSEAELRADRSPQAAWWAAVTDHPVDRATVMFPALLRERMGELGIDYSVLYTTHGLSTCAIEHEELRRGVARGFNDYYAEVYGPHRKQLAVAGIIPMHTPREAIEELEHCKRIGLKVVGFPEGVRRPIEAGPSSHPSLWPGQAHWFDTFGLDSAHDYDPVWAKAQELGFAVTFHGSLGLRPGAVSSPTSYVYNHVGMFAGVSAPVCKSLFLGGVTRRFPGLAFAFLECGVSWATQMLGDLIEHWERRNLDALRANLDPERLRPAEVETYFERYGGAIRERLEGDFGQALAGMPIDGATPAELDEWKHLGVRSPDEIVERFAPSFYFGCEAGDRGVATAFPPIPARGARLNAIFSSDMGHWDVTRLDDVVPEAFELLDGGLVSPEDFRRFCFENPVALYRKADPDFFAGTALETAVAELPA